MLIIKKWIISILPKEVTLLISKVKLIIRKPFLTLNFHKSFQQQAKPVFILSFPRGGSSWVGAILGSAENARYLREPITTGFFYQKEQSASVFSKAKCENWRIYSKLIAETLNTKLPAIDKVVAYPNQWTTPEQPRITVIKEINPLIIDELAALDVQPIYLVRHPYSVAKSYKALGWDKKNQFETRFTKNEIHKLLKSHPNLLQQNYFYQIGYLQGLIEHKVRSHNLTPICYEDLVKHPETKFSQLFNQYGLTMTESCKEKINTSLSSTKSVSPGDFGLFRNQLAQSRILVTEQEKSCFSSTMKGYKDALHGVTPIYNDSKYVEEVTHEV